VLVEPAPPEDPEEREVMLSIIEPAPKPTPVGVGAEGGAEDGKGDDGGDQGDAPEGTSSDEQ
jgi:hypothetical protein